MFNYNVNTTDQKAQSMAGTGLSPELRIFYDKNIIKEATAILVHDQFGQKRPVPKNSGRIIEFTKLSPLGPAMTPLSEGVTPDGNKLTWSKAAAELKQYGDYVTLSDMFITTDIDAALVEAGIVLGNQAGETLDTITREVLASGTNVMFADGVAARHLLTGGGAANPEDNDYLTVECIKKAVRTLKRNNAKPIKGSYVCIIHPDVAYDLMEDPKWENPRTYADPTDLYNGEIGRIYGVRFVETAAAKIFKAKDLTAGSRTLKLASFSNNIVNLQDSLSESDAVKLIGRDILIKGYIYTVEQATAGSGENPASITLDTSIYGSPSAGEIIYPGEAGAEGRDIYATLILGSDAYGVTELEGGGLQNIVKQLGSGGTADPLDQRATTGWKATKAAEILVDEYMVRIETASSFN